MTNGKKRKKTNGTFLWCDYSTERKVRETLMVALQYTSEADLSELIDFGLCFKFCVCAPIIPYVQAAILNYSIPIKRYTYH